MNESSRIYKTSLFFQALVYTSTPYSLRKFARKHSKMIDNYNSNLSYKLQIESDRVEARKMRKILTNVPYINHGAE